MEGPPRAAWTCCSPGNGCGGGGQGQAGRGGQGLRVVLPAAASAPVFPWAARWLCLVTGPMSPVVLVPDTDFEAPNHASSPPGRESLWWGVGQRGVCRVMLGLVGSESGSPLLCDALSFWRAGQLCCALGTGVVAKE